MARVVCGEGFVHLWISARETSDWARRWPCSTLRNRRVFAAFDRGGLVDFAIDGRNAPDDLDATEFNAMSSDFLAPKVPVDHPVRFIAVDQFKA